MNKKIKQGFTLIELVVVMVIIGILAAVAIPQFTDVSQNASNAVANGLCATLTSQAVLLYASNKSASSYSTIRTAFTPTNGTPTWGGTCSAPTLTWTPSSGPASASTNCAAIPAALCN